MIILQALLYAFFAATCLAQTSRVEVVVPETQEDEYNHYFNKLLKLALEKTTDESGKQFSYNYVPILPSARQFDQLEAGNISTYWAATSIDLESRFIPIRIPLYKGLLGYRVLLIRRGEQQRFDSINSLEQLKSVFTGQGSDWNDTRILKANGFNIVTAHKYNSLFHMLDGGRFDAFPRGVFEPWNEIKEWPNLPMEVEKNLLISYKMPFYYFVDKANPEFAADIENGLTIAIEDGSFEQLLMESPRVKQIFESAGLSNRLVFELTNPDLTPETPINDPRLWFKLGRDL